MCIRQPSARRAHRQLLLNILIVMYETRLLQARKPRSYASLKLRPTDRGEV